jgi:DNA-binding MarR family transcriptional regulator
MIGELHSTMPHHTKDLSRLMPLLRHATTHLGVEQTPTGKALGLTNARMMALAAVGGAETCSMGDLAQRLSLSAPLATRVADELVARDLVERLGDPSDRRRVVLRLTEEGRAALETVHGEAEELVSNVLLRMTEAETEALLVGLRAFLRVLHAPAPDGTPPTLPAHDHDFPTERNA